MLFRSTQQPFTASDYATTTATAPAPVDATAPAATTKKKAMPAGTAKQAVDTAVSAIQSVRKRDRGAVAKYAQDKLLGVGQPASSELKFTGRRPGSKSKGLSKQQKDYIKSIGVDESLSWSKSFDPGMTVWNRMHESK